MIVPTPAGIIVADQRLVSIELSLKSALTVPAGAGVTLTVTVATLLSPRGVWNGSEGLLALIEGKFLTFRVPYPMGFYAKGMDGRIDNASGGWKGKGIWTTYATRAPFHAEGGKGTTSRVVTFQVRPDPLAK